MGYVWTIAVDCTQLVGCEKKTPQTIEHPVPVCKLTIQGEGTGPTSSSTPKNAGNRSGADRWARGLSFYWFFKNFNWTYFAYR